MIGKTVTMTEDWVEEDSEATACDPNCGKQASFLPSRRVLGTATTLQPPIFVLRDDAYAGHVHFIEQTAREAAYNRSATTMDAQLISLVNTLQDTFSNLGQ